MKYISGSNIEHTQEEMLKVIKERVIHEKSMGHEVNLVIGTDSQCYRGGYKYAVVIALHFVGHGGIYWRKIIVDKSHYGKTKGSLSARMFREASESVIEAQALEDTGIMEYIDNRIIIHIDCSRAGDTSPYIDAIKGMITAYGYEGYCKPNATVASTIADRYAKRG